jgi:hypothetical protein
MPKRNSDRPICGAIAVLMPKLSILLGTHNFVATVGIENLTSDRAREIASQKRGNITHFCLAN